MNYPSFLMNLINYITLMYDFYATYLRFSLIWLLLPFKEEVAKNFKSFDEKILEQTIQFDNQPIQTKIKNLTA